MSENDNFGWSAPRFDYDGPWMKCPHCRGTHLHMAGVQVVGNPEEPPLSQVGPFPFDEVPYTYDSLRGAITQIGFYCENCLKGHVLSFRFHKGSVVTEIFDTGDAPGGSWDSWDIWRD